MVSKKILSVLENVSRDYDLDLDELITRYCKSKKRGNVDNDYIETEEIFYENRLYLIDKNNNVYSHSLKEPRFVGVRLLTGAIQFIQ
jgi:hypothetical protein